MDPRIDPAVACGSEVLWCEVRVTSGAAAGFSRLLTDEERDRAGRMVHDGARQRFVTARGALRAWLGQLASVPPAHLVLIPGAHGKPALAPAIPGGWEFNVAHSGDRVLMAAAPGRAVGVDLEPVRPAGELRRVAERWFAPGEQEALHRLDGAQFDHAFFRLWTRKEAWLKALGTGISGGLRAHQVDADPAPGPRVVRDRDGGTWTLLDLPLPDGWQGTLAAAGTGWTPTRVEAPEP